MTKVLKKSDVISQRGGGLVEVLLAMVIIAVAAPFTYSAITDATHMIHDMAIANDIISSRASVLNFVRLNQDLWPGTIQVKLSDEEKKSISDSVSAGFVDKYVVRGGDVIDVYLGFNIETSPKRVARIASNIGPDAAVVGNDGIAYGDTWAVTSPDFAPGNIVYKISRESGDFDTTRFLHRGTSGENSLNTMLRDLNMGGHDIYHVGGINGKSLRVRNLGTTFVSAETIDTKSVYFSAGANMGGTGVSIGTLRVSGDISGFRNVTAKKLSGTGIDLNGRVVADRATVNNSINVGADFILKSTSIKTISGFAGMTTGTVYAPYLSAGELTFLGTHGLTVSGELLLSSNAPIKLGNWSFPSKNPPSFEFLSLARSPIPKLPLKDEFAPIIKSGWKTTEPINNFANNENEK